MAFDATPGGATADSYTTVAEADAYHDTRLFTDTWGAANESDKEKALKWATRTLDEQIEWIGSIATSGQALRWPRAGVVDPDGRSISSSIVPTWLKHATAELARLLIDADRAADPESAGIQSVKAGPVEVVFDPKDRKPVIPPSVAAMVEPYGRIKSSFHAKLIRA